jgi:uncharacterized protein YkwD
MHRSARRFGILLCIVSVALVPAQTAAAGKATDRKTASAASRAIVGEINAVRTAHGLGPVRASSTLIRDAKRYAGTVLQRDELVHAQDLTGQGFAFGGEVLAFVRKPDPQAAQTVRAWMGSPTHHAVLMNPRYTHVGLGLRRGEFRGGTAWVWVGRFGTRAPR